MKTSVGKGITSRERVVFPTRIPPQVKELIKSSSSLDKVFFRKLIKLSLGYIDGSYNETECEAAFNNLCTFRECQDEDQVMALSVLYSGVISLLRASLKAKSSSIRQEAFASDLIEIGLPSEFAADICKVIYGPNRADIDDRIVANNPHLPLLEKLDWRVDVTISSSWISKLLEPVIQMKLTTDTGEEKSFEVPVSQFHQLRYTTADLLHKMDEIQMSKIKKDSSKSTS